MMLNLHGLARRIVASPLFPGLALLLAADLAVMLLYAALR